MPAYTTHAIRNLALVGQAGSGKTTLLEALLHHAGVSGSAGTVEGHTTLSDFTPEEHEHGHSLYSCVLHADTLEHHLNLLDTPGSPDFLGRALGVFTAVETVAVVINAHHGIEPITRRLMRRAKERNLCRAIVINKIDQASPEELLVLLDQLREQFGNCCLPVNLPADQHTRVVDCFKTSDGQSDLGPVADYHKAIIEQVVEVDEDLMATYLEQGNVQPEQLHDPFEKALREGHLVPVVFTAARPHAHGQSNGSATLPPVGIDALLRFIVELCPDPTEGNPPAFIRGSDLEHELHAQPDANKHVLAHVFNIRIDPYRGKLAAFRVHQGTVTRDSQLFIDDPHTGESKRPVKVGHLYKLQGAQTVEVDRAIPGDIVALAKVDDVHFDAVLHDSHDEDDLHLKPLRFPQAMAGLAISPKNRGDEQKLADALHRMQEEDPTFRVSRPGSTHETVIHGLGDLHLRVILEKLDKRYHLEVETAPPKIEYRETITTTAHGHCRHKKQTGGAGQFGEVSLRVEPLERGAGFEFVDDTFGGSVPRQFMPAVEKGVRQALVQGAIAGYPLQDLRVSVYDGKHHPVDSKEIAFVTAARRAVLDAVSKARPVLLEPLVELEATAPRASMGDMTADLSVRRGRVMGTDMLPGELVRITATVPLSELLTYGNQLKSMTSGQGTFTMDLSHYEPCPLPVQQRVAAGYQPAAEDDS